MSKANANGARPTEPSEVEPCMETADSVGAKRSNAFVNFRSKVCEKWNLSHEVFYAFLGLLVLLLLLLITVIALGAAFPNIPHSQRFPVCKDSACLRAASQIREAMNSSVSPCSDLWTWACGGWLSLYPLPEDKSVWNQKQQLVRQEITKIRDLIPTLDLPLTVGSVEWKLKHLYEACMNIDNVKNDDARPLTSIIDELAPTAILGRTRSR